MEQGATHIYRALPKKKPFSWCGCPVGLTQKALEQQLINNPRVEDPFKVIKHTLHHSIDENHIFLHVKFEGGSSSSFDRKSVSKKKWWPDFFQRRSLKIHEA
jgi:hypothetical protein